MLRKSPTTKVYGIQAALQARRRWPERKSDRDDQGGLIEDSKGLLSLRKGVDQGETVKKL